MKPLYFLAFVLSAASASAQTASHERPAWCATGSMLAEQTICADARLSQLDFKLTEVYKFWLSRMQPDMRAQYRGDQRDWLAVRNACKANILCIEDAYIWRLDQLGF